MLSAGAAVELIWELLTPVYGDFVKSTLGSRNLKLGQSAAVS